MASKSELLDAQSFSRRRLLTAFVSGAPGGRELEPAKPLRGVIAGVALSIVVVLVGLFMGFIQKGLPADWGEGKLIIDQSTGSRYITIENELWPVLNIASARLLLEPDASADPIVVSGGLLTGKPVRDTIGIPGAPDTIPTPSNLVNAGWTACIADDAGNVDTRIAASPIAKPAQAGDAVLVTFDERLWVISGTLRMEIPVDSADGILRDLSLGSAPIHTVTTNWLNLFDEGDALWPINAEGAGQALPGSSVRVGDVLSTSNADDATRFLVLADGSLAELSALSFALYQHGSTYSADRTYVVDAPEIASMPNTSPDMQATITSPDWPKQDFTMMDVDQVPCAMTTADDSRVQTVLAGASDEEQLEPGVTVEPSAGALVEVSGFGEGSGATTLMIDSTATSYAIPGADATILAKLGFTQTDRGKALAPWIMLFHGGPDLTAAGAGTQSDGSSQ